MAARIKTVNPVAPTPSVRPKRERRARTPPKDEQRRSESQGTESESVEQRIDEYI